jgi:hypothetical protein
VGTAPSGGAWRDLGFWSWGRGGARDLGFRRFCPFRKAWVSLLGFGRGGSDPEPLGFEL